MAGVNYAGANHIVLVTNDMDATVRFYRDVLDMPVVATLGNNEHLPHRHYFMSIGRGAHLAFFEWEDAELPPRKDSGVPGSGRQFDHVSVSVDSDADLEALRKRLTDVGSDVSEIVDHGIVRSVYVTDPNGISLEFSVSARDLVAEPYFMDPHPVAGVGTTR